MGGVQDLELYHPRAAQDPPSYLVIPGSVVVATKTRTGHRIPPRALEIIGLIEQGMTQTQAAAALGISKQRVHQVVQRHRPDLLVYGDAKYREFAERAKTARPCLICGYWIFARNRVTCGGECSWLYRQNRDRLREDIRRKHYERLARWILVHEPNNERWRTNWARRILAGEMPTRHWWVPGSTRRRAARVLGLVAPVPKPTRYLYP